MNKPFKVMMEETWSGACWNISSQSGSNFQENSNGKLLLWPSERQFGQDNQFRTFGQGVPSSGGRVWSL
ncbi:hypothetical protein [Phaeobacter sp. NW0010-22]|uniref:hypothetical protein n=1 Tax=Phaeobacter sp. NW0010-22 TaxID=3135907 RepID=UPI0031086BE4